MDLDFGIDFVGMGGMCVCVGGGGVNLHLITPKNDISLLYFCFSVLEGFNGTIFAYGQVCFLSCFIIFSCICDI